MIALEKKCIKKNRKFCYRIGQLSHKKISSTISEKIFDINMIEKNILLSKCIFLVFGGSDLSKNMDLKYIRSKFNIYKKGTTSQYICYNIQDKNYK